MRWNDVGFVFVSFALRAVMYHMYYFKYFDRRVTQLRVKQRRNVNNMTSISEERMMRSLNEPLTKRRVITLLKTNLRHHRLSTLNKYYPSFAFIVRFSSISN